MVREGLILAAAICAVTASATDAAPAKPSLLTEANAFLDAYVSGNWPAVESALSHKSFSVYGSDVSEFATTMPELKAEFDADQKLWHGAATFGETSQVSQFVDGPVAGLFFTREFKVGSQTVNVRFATVWHLEDGHWKLVQSANAVPTVGQSASEILKASATK
jgi:hypothetical protein